tara:strand:- start:305 stop:697 length:393 start_codon:yes stop_codon:yes gene_type:complete
MKKYFAKIIATDNEGLRMISACCSGSKIRVSNMKYLKNNKIFLLSLERINIENEDVRKKINSICKFDFVENVRSKNINQKDTNLVLELVAIDYLKNKEDYEINLIFDNNAHIILKTESIEVKLEDQNEIK